MKITICGSIAFYAEMQEMRQQLEFLGHEVKLPPVEVADEDGNMIPVGEYYIKRKAETNETGWIWDRKEEAMRLHFQKVEWCDTVLILNYEKNGIANYIGANTLLEMGLAFHLRKKIFLLNPIPEISYKEEILGMKPIIINGNLSKIE
jgi:hypothetical protein